MKRSDTHLFFRTLGKMPEQQYRFVRSFLDELPGSSYHAEKYAWAVPITHLDLVVEKIEHLICWEEPVEDIRGIVEDLTPDFDLIDEMDDFHLEPFPYQKVGISFLVSNRRGVIGDEMGLGKSFQAIGAAHVLHQRGEAKRVLVICPSSLKYQWAEEVEKFTDHKALVIDGTPKKREKLYALYEQTEPLFCISNYEMVRSDLDHVKRLGFDVICLDEAHRIKNRSSQTFKALIQLDAPYKFALTGTPMQNRPEEIHALMSWIDKDALGGITQFRKDHIVYGERFGRKFVPIGAKRLGELRRKISPFLLRRMKREVMTDLPPLIITDHYVDMTKEQQKIMDAIAEDMARFQEELETFFEENPDAERHPNDTRAMGFLNMLIATSDHPKLLSLSTSEYAKQVGFPGKAARTSPKLDALVELAVEAMDNGVEKIVVFTQFARMKDLIDRRLRETFGPDRVGAGIDGSMNTRVRQDNLNTFRETKKLAFFVMTDAGATGLNIQFAPLLVNFDTPWNPSIVEQRNGRIHRVGGDHDSYHVINLITNDSIDELIQRTVQKKKKLNNKIVGRNAKELATMQQMLSRYSK